MTEVVGLIWSFLTGVTIPFLNISVATFILTIIVINLSINVISILLGLGRGKGRLARTSSSKKGGRE